MADIKKLGIIANMERPDAEAVIGRLVAWAQKTGMELIFGEQINEKHAAEFDRVPNPEVAARADVIVSLGGDGTLLASARAVGKNGTPILGINLGSLGFLTQLTPDVLEQSLDAIAEKQYRIEERMVIEVEVEEGPEIDHPFALNDVVVDRGSVSRVITLDLYANDYFVCSYAADGLIIASPTGSTAYSLAVGGPILNPLMGAFIVSPISAFSLTTRPILFSPEDELRIVAKSTHSQPVLTLDGQVSCNLPQEASLLIRRADYNINFIVFRKNVFYDVLRNKLHWGRLPEGDGGSLHFK